MSIPDNNFGLPEVPNTGEPSETSQSTETGSLGDHNVSTTGDENPQVSGQGEETIQHLGDESMEAHQLPPGISINTSGSERASQLAEDIHFSITSEGSPGISRSGSFSSLSSLGESASLDTTRSSSPTPSSRSAGSTSGIGASKLEDHISPLPKYDPTSKSSIQEFLKDPGVLANMKEKGGHYIYLDESRSSFIFIPNGDFSKAKSIKVTNGKSKESIQNPKDLEMCISKFATAFNQVETNWEGSGATQIRQDLGLSQDTPVKFTHFTLNLKYKQAIAYGPFNAKESSRGYTASAWRRGTKVKVNKDIWADTGGLNSVDLSKRSPQETSDEGIHYSTETPTHIYTGTSPLPGASPQPQQPVVVNINVAGGQGGQGGSSTSISHPSQEKSSPSTEDAPERPGTPIIEKTITYSEDGQTDNNVGNDIGVNTSTVTAPISPSIITEQTPIETPSENTSPKSRITSLALTEDPSDSSRKNPLIDAARQTSEKLQDLLNTVINAPGNPINPSSTPSLSPSNSNELETILKAVRAHVETAYGPQGRRQAGGIAQVVKAAENNLQDIIDTGHNSDTGSTEKIPGLPSLNLPEEKPGNKDLINAAQDTSMALQNLLTTVIQAPTATPPPSAPEETNQLETILKAVRAHVETAYGPQGRRQAGGISQVIKEAEK